MTFIVQDGTGTGNKAKVNADNRMLTDAVTRTSQEDANFKGKAYNINTGVLTLTSGSESGILYLKNTDPLNDLHVDTIIVGMSPSTGGDSTEIPKITIVRNPSAGTVVSDATAVDITSNRNFGSSNTLTGLAYKGGEGKTLTNGTDHILAFQGANGRLVLPIDEILPNGTALGVKLDPQTSNTNMDVYVAVVCHSQEAE